MAETMQMPDAAPEAHALVVVAKVMREAAYAAWKGTLIGGAPEFLKRRFKRMQEPQVGDWVFECTTIHMPERDLDAVGVLEEIAWEPVDFGAGAEPWNEAEEGRPHPTERIYYIRTLDGVRYRWSNAQMLTIPTYELEQDFAR